MHSLNSLSSFTQGEYSPNMDSRIDLAGYRKACRLLRNMVPLKTGGATRRPGTQYIAQGKVAQGGSAALSISSFRKFQYAPNTTFQLEFCDKGIRFCTGGSNPAQVQQLLANTPAWATGTNYAAGAFVAVSTTIYYLYNGPLINSTVTPGSDPTHWVAQTAYEVPAPYSGTNFTIPDYWAADVCVLQCKQINDVMYIVHPNFPVWKLTRFSNTNWTMQQVQFLTPPMLDQNVSQTVLVPSAASGNGITVTAECPIWLTGTLYSKGDTVSDNSAIWTCQSQHVSGTFNTDVANGYWTQTTIFQAGHVGSYWQLSYNRNSSAVTYDLTTSAGMTTPMYLIGGWEVQTYGTWEARIIVEASYDNGFTWQVITNLISNNNANYDISGEDTVGGLYRLVITDWVNPSSSVPPEVVLQATNQFVYGLIEITAVAGPYSATANVITDIYSVGISAWSNTQAYNFGDLATDSGVPYFCFLAVTGGSHPSANPGNWVPGINGTQYWSEGAWSGVRGYPTAITIFQERAWYANTTFQPQRIWGTQTDDLENFAIVDQSQATYGLVFDLNAPGRGPIQWMTAQTDLMCGLAGAEWIITSGSQTAAITPTAVIALEHSANGSSPATPGQIIGNAAFYVQRRGINFQQMLFSVFTNKYMSQDMQVLAQHLAAPGIKQFDYQQQFQQQSLLWAVVGDGSLISMNYAMDQEVFGWSKHTPGVTAVNIGFQTSFISVSTIYGADGQDDETWVVVYRGPSGCTIERIAPLDWQTANMGQPEVSQAWYADCAVQVTGPSTNVISGLPAILNGQPLVASINGTIAVSDLTGYLGTVTIPNYQPAAGNQDVIVVGLAIPWFLQPMRFDVDPRAGEVPGVTKSVFRIYLKTLNSVGGNWMTKQGEVIPLANYLITQNSGNPPPFLPGVPIERYIDVGALFQYESDPQFILTGTDPLPFTCLSLAIAYDITGKS